jgi:TolA-binding protein
LLTRVQAFQALAKGERAATALENQLNEMEAKIEELLVQAERQQEDAKKIQEAGASTNGDATST